MSLDFKRTYDTSEGNTHNVAPAEVIASLLSASGVREEAPVLVYASESDYRPSCRLFWVLEVYGHSSVSVLNGGIEAWVAAGGELSTDEVVPSPSQYIPRFDPSRFATKLQVARAVRERDRYLLDTRIEEEYTGEKKRESFSRWGHIPDAHNLDMKDIRGVREDHGCTWIDPDAMRSVLGRPRGRGRDPLLQHGTQCEHRIRGPPKPRGQGCRVRRILDGVVAGRCPSHRHGTGAGR